MSESDRLKYREINEQDAERLVAWRSNPDVYQHFLYPHKITIEEHLSWYREHYLKDDARIDYIACEKESLQPVGVFGIKKVREQSVEVSYLLKPDAQGKGYAKEAVAWLIQEAKNKWKAKKVLAEVHRLNYSSIKLVEHLDFKQVAAHDEFLVYEKDV